ncbi:MAG: hypothetical protein H6581_10935 [Bacteroidia bacterium]|nr:hypothetical protein [Bacteroidia bacterium]
MREKRNSPEEERTQFELQGKEETSQMPAFQRPFEVTADQPIQQKSADGISGQENSAPEQFTAFSPQATVQAKSAKASTQAIQRKTRFSDDYPWEGVVVNAWSAALRKTPQKDPNNPHGNTLADVPKGSRVSVIGKSGSWF